MHDQTSKSAAPHYTRAAPFSEAARDGVYQAIFSRRDVRGEFMPDRVDDSLLWRLLEAAHHAPSVGFMQPWNFVVVREQAVKQKIADIFSSANAEAAKMFPDEKRSRYQALKLEGILTAPVNICVTCDRQRAGPVVLGATHMENLDLFSTVCAIQNLWLAARAEGIGLGWVSILHVDAVKSVLGIPAEIEFVAYLCLGYVQNLYRRPELEERGWRGRLELDKLIYDDGWGKSSSIAAARPVEG